MSEESKTAQAIPAEKFTVLGTDDFSGDVIARPRIGYW